MNTPDRGDLIASLRQVASDAEALLQDEKVAGLRARVTESSTQARRRPRQIEGRVTDRARIAALVTDRYVRRNPWKALGVASSIALLAGVLLPAISRRGAGRKPTK